MGDIIGGGDGQVLKTEMLDSLTSSTLHIVVSPFCKKQKTNKQITQFYLL